MVAEPILHFHKMHGAGNDFVVLDWRGCDESLTAEKAARIANRKLGVGCDQILIIRDASEPGCSAAYEILNADGSEAGQCGNGARCIALFLQMTGQPDRQFVLQSPAGPIQVDRCDDGEFELDMGVPRFDPADLPARLPTATALHELETPTGPVRFYIASMGNPHALIPVENVDSADVNALGTYLGQHEVFPEGCNIGFAEVLDRSTIRLRVFERGAGETLACGSGACAAVAMLNRAGLVDGQVRVFLPGGILVLKWPGPGKGIRMKGPAAHIFSGKMPKG